LNRVSVRCCLYQSSIYNKLTTHMNRLRARTWQIVAVLVILTFIGTYFYFRFMGLSHPFAELIGRGCLSVQLVAVDVIDRDFGKIVAQPSMEQLNFVCLTLRDPH